MSSPNGPRSTPENGTAPHLAHPVMRHQPAHMSRDTDVDDSRCAPPAEPEPRKQRGRITPARLTGRTPYECSGMTPENCSRTGTYRPRRRCGLIVRASFVRGSRGRSRAASQLADGRTERVCKPVSAQEPGPRCRVSWVPPRLPGRDRRIPARARWTRRCSRVSRPRASDGRFRARCRVECGRPRIDLQVVTDVPSLEVGISEMVSFLGGGGVVVAARAASRVAHGPPGDAAGHHDTLRRRVASGANAGIAGTTVLLDPAADDAPPITTETSKTRSP